MLKRLSGWIGKHDTKGVLIIFLLVLLGWQETYQRQWEQETLTRIQGIEAAALTEISDLRADLQRKQYTLDLSVEFGFDPIVVETAIYFAEETMKDVDLESVTWRYLNTAEELTNIMLSIASIESGGNPSAIGDSGNARGLTQIWTSTAQQYDPDVTATELLGIEKNLEISFQHFVDLLEANHGNMTFAALAWNRGQGAISRSIARGEMPFNGYVERMFVEAAMRNAAL